MQGQWLIYGGQPRTRFCWDFLAPLPLSELHVFDFNTLSWSHPDLSAPLPALRGHAAVCHNGAMLVAGGVSHHILACSDHVSMLFPYRCRQKIHV